MSLHSVAYIFISSLLTLFPVLNPVGDGLIVNGYLKGLDAQQRKRAVKKIFVNCVLISIGSLLLGHFILILFGLAVPVIQVGGGFIICKTCYDLLLSNDNIPAAKQSPDDIRQIDQDALNMKLFYPISFPISIDPGTISVIFTLMATVPAKSTFLSMIIHYAAIALAIIILIWLLCLFLVHGGMLMKRLGDSANTIINKLVAFLTFCIGIQILLTGISKIFNIAANL